MDNNKFALITGGSRGIGKSIACKLAKEGFHVAFTYSQSDDEAKNTLSKLNKISNYKHLSIKADSAKPDEISKLAKKIRAEYGSLNLLINNACWTQFIEHNNLADLTPEIFDKIYKINLRGSYLAIREHEDLFVDQDNALIINIASIASISAIGSNIAYCAIKAGLVNMTKSMARSLAPKIRVNSISPALTDTELTKGWSNYRSEQIKKTPLERLGSCDDIANTAWSLYDRMKFVTGQDIVVDGGRLLN